jgi:tripartite-type tricarboxylate transporter receptor subunit TctC
MFATPQSVLGMIAGRKLRALAVTSTNRIGVLSQVPTVSEEGYKGFEATDWKIVVAPAGTPPEAIKKINEAVQKSLKNPALISKLQDEASSPMYGDPATVLKYIRTEQREWDAAVKAAGIKLD